MIASDSRLGPYEILSRVGAGGMGEVWRARDTRIGREVAIKVLPPDLTASAERLRRFEQEARSAGTLNHPNLVTIHDVGTHDGVPYIVMELLEGDTLRDRIGSDSGPRLPIRKAVEVSVQLARGLAAAHEKGIVHRDLKPENIFVTRDGRVKILDFGLAKLTLADSESNESRTQQRDTSPGAVVGTAGYMSPEQVRGQAVDHRTDIFAFGAILYEMLTGRRAFRRDSSVETMHAILTDDPPEVSSSAHHVPPAVDRIVRRCLEKSREERFQSARDLGFALEGMSGSSAHEAIVPVGEPRWPRASLLAVIAVAALIATALAYGAYRFGARSVTPPLMPTFSQLTFVSGIEDHPAIAPSGETFVYVREGDIYLQRTDGRNAINLTKTADVRESAPAFSPDGRQIAFHSNTPPGGIFVMGATGESVRRITSLGYDPSWSPDGTKILFTRDERTDDPRSRNTTASPLMIVPLGGGAPRLLLAHDVMQPQWSPDGRRIAFWANDDAGRRDIYTVAANGAANTIVRVTNDAALDWSAVWSPDSHWLYFSSERNGTLGLWRVAVDSASGRTLGAPQLIPAPTANAGRMSISADGRKLLFESASSTSAIYVADFDTAKGTLTVADAPVMEGSLAIRNSSRSPDGSMIAFTTSGREDLFVMRSDGTDLRQLTDDDAKDRGPTWSSDGQRIGFYSSRSGSYQLWQIRPDGSELTQLSEMPSGKLPNFPAFSPDGTKVAAPALEGGAWIGDLARLPIRSPEFLPRIAADGNSSFFPQSWSPDGKRLAGVPWGNREKVFIYSLDDHTYHFVADGFRRAAFVDADHLLLKSEEKLWLLDLRTGARRELLSKRFDMLPASREHFSFETTRSEGDIWMATLH